MKKSPLRLTTGLLALLLLGGCVVGLGTGGKTITQNPTLGQQLIDLQKAKDSGALTDAEFQAQKAKLLEAK